MGRSPRTQWIRIVPDVAPSHEMITGFLITVPWIALSWLSNQYVQPTSPDSQVDDLDETASNGDLDGGVVVGLDDAVGGAALAGDVAIEGKKNMLVIFLLEWELFFWLWFRSHLFRALGFLLSFHCGYLALDMQ